MWIIPSNHPLSSHFVQECTVSRQDLSGLSDQLEPSLTWRSKRLSSKMWYDKWKKVYWLPHLFGRMLKPFPSKVFTTKYTGSLADIRVSPSPTPAFEEVQPILDTFGRSLRVALKNRGLWEFGSRMSRATYRLAYGTFLRTYENWVIKLRSDYSRRQKSELPIEETGSLFSDSTMPSWGTPRVTTNGETGYRTSNHKSRLEDQVSWPTPETGDIHLSPSTNLRPTNRKKGPKNFHQGVNWTTPLVGDEGRNGKFAQGGTPLSAQVKEWPTVTVKGNHNTTESSPKAGNGLATEVKLQEWPTAQSRDFRAARSMGGDNSRPLNEVVAAWTTPQSHDAKLGANFNPDRDKDYKSLSAEARRDGQQGQESDSTTGSTLGLLNPAWVMQLMGTTLEKTFFAWREMPWYHSKQKEHSEL